MTDANLALCRLSPTIKLAGSVSLDQSLAEEAIGRIVQAISGLDVPRAAEGIIRIAVARMVSAIKEISVARGHDPRDFVLTAFGGAGPMHAAFIAEELEMSHVLIPLRPGNFCAFGALISDIRHDHVRTYRLALDAGDLADIEPSFARMEADARRAMIDEGMAAERITMARATGMRYRGQSWDLVVRLPGHVDDVRELERLFHEAHEQRFGYRAADPVEIVSLRVSAIGQVTKPELGDWPIGGTLEGAYRETRSTWFSGKKWPVPVYLRDRLPGRASFDGPAIVEEMGSVTIVPPGWGAEVGRLGELQLRRREP